MTSEVMGLRRTGPTVGTVTTIEMRAEQPIQVGQLLRSWRERRRLSQLDLSLQADVSTRHLSYVETGRSRPTSSMILHLSDRLEIPLRERNALLLAGGYAPAFPESALDAPPMAAVNDAINAILAGHQPYPAVVVDRHWELVAGNDAVALLTVGAAPHLLEPPVNVLRLSLHPDGMAPRIVNLAEWRGHVLHRLAHQAQTTGDQWLYELHAELSGYPGGTADPQERVGAGAIVVPLRYWSGDTELSFFSTTTVFGTPLDVTVAELAIEAFYPTDAATAEILRRSAS
jgi:transcriptional regulator with XRE-family HTH domain